MLFALLRFHGRSNKSDGNTEECENRGGKFGITLDEIIVCGNHVRVFSAQPGHINGGVAGDGFTFTGGFFGDPSIIENHTRHELDIELAVILTAT